MYLSVTRDTFGKDGLINIKVDDVLFLEFDMTEKGVIVHTRDEKFFITGTLNYWAETLKSTGYEFEKSDRNIVIHIPKIKRLDRIFTFAYFDYEVNTYSKRVTLSQKHFKKIVSMVREIDPLIIIV
jgi:DNA-binding LytR/AlgR family response regulator